MKRLILITLSIITMTSFGQVDSSKNVTIRQGDNQLIQQPQPDLIKIEASQLPPQLLEVLSKPRYKGWENAMIYRQKSTREYIIEISKKGNSKTYRFTEEGTPIKSDRTH
jgi:hypothetical protein